MALLVRLCRRYGPDLEPIRLHPPAVITKTYEDQCGCRTCCSYPNNVWALLPAQLLVAVAVASSAYSYIDCRLVKVANTRENEIDDFTIRVLYNGTTPVGVINNNATYRSLGVFGWEDIQGDCSHLGDFEEEGTAKHPELVGSDFVKFQVLGGVVAILGLFVFLWLVCLQSCVAHTQRYRRIVAALLIVILPLLQSLMFRILATDFCRQKNCRISDGGVIATVAVVVYFIAGIILLVGTQDFPGNPYRKRKPILPTSMRRWFGERTETLSSGNTESRGNQMTANATYPRGATSPTSPDQIMTTTPTTEMTNYHNGFADAVEIPVESEFIDRTLIDADFSSAVTFPPPSQQQPYTTPMVDWAELIRHSSPAGATTTTMSDHHPSQTSPNNVVKSNV